MAEGGLIIGLCYPQQQDALASATLTMVEDFNATGRDALLVDISNKIALAQLVKQLQSGAVDFCFGVQGVGSSLTAGDDNLWSAHRIPFVNLHFDHPCHNPLNHVSPSAYVGNLYYFDSFCLARQRYLGNHQLCGTIKPDFFRPVKHNYVQDAGEYALRPFRYLYVKSGVDMQQVTGDVNAIHVSVRDAVWQQISYAWHHPNVELCDLVDDVFRAVGYDRTVYQKQFWGIVQIMDLYIRARRSLDFVNWLKMQEGAVIIGDGWQSLDRNGARARFCKSLPIDAAYGYYSQSQIVCNTNPHGTDIIHERVVRGLLEGCVALSDTNDWWNCHYGDVQNVKLFDWAEGWQDRVEVLAHQAAFSADLFAYARERAESDFTHKKSYGAIAAFAQQIRQKTFSA